MKTDLNDPKIITVLVDQNKNITIFPEGKGPKMKHDDTPGEYSYGVALMPIEVQYPYMVENLAQRIEEGFDAYLKYPIEPWEEGKKTYEEKYYGIKGFKNAVRGKKHFFLGWDDDFGKYIAFSLPLRRGYGYMGIESVYLPEDADYVDFAKALVDLIEADVHSFRRYKTFKKQIDVYWQENK